MRWLCKIGIHLSTFTNTYGEHSYHIDNEYDCYRLHTTTICNDCGKVVK